MVFFHKNKFVYTCFHVFWSVVWLAGLVPRLSCAFHAGEPGTCTFFFNFEHVPYRGAHNKTLINYV